MRHLGQTDIQITPVIMGTWQAGKRGWIDIDDAQTVAAIRAAFDAGVTTIDTAEIYGDGHSEAMVARALSDVRDRAVYASKVFANHLKYDQVLAACDRSLKQLQTDYIDLYQIHWPSGSFNSHIVPIGETMRALQTLKERGKIRAIGVSNFSRQQLEEAAQYGRIDSLQPPYSLFWRKIEADIVPYCIENNITILAYSSLAQGLLTGKFGPDHQFQAKDNRAENTLFQGDTYQRALMALEKLRPIAEHYQTTVGNLAIAWLIAQPQTCAIVGARNAAQATQNAAAATIQLSKADLAKIDAIGRTVTDSMDNTPVMWKWN